MATMIKTGVEGLDELFKGGLKENSSILLQGSPGTGKTILALQFIYQGALMGEPGLFITSEIKADDLREYALSLGMDLRPLEKKGIFHIVEQPILRGNIVSIDTPLKIIKQSKIKRVVLDSLTLFQYEFDHNTTSLRKALLTFISSMKAAGVTLMVTAERTIEGVRNIRFEPEDFLFDGLIFLIRVRKGASYERCLSIMKMRGQDHSTEIYPISIGKGGVKVYPEEIPFALIDDDVRRGNGIK